MKPSGHLARCLILTWVVTAVMAFGFEIDPTKLPPSATGKIDFAIDIKPILEGNCLRCHNGERPKSNFRLTDRVQALKGGENGVDIIPGASEKSPLVHYVARLVPDFEMPPEGKGAPLSTNQVSTLRAWIDQGVVWNDAGATQTVTSAIFVPRSSWTSVQGDRGKFRELESQPDGWNGGVENFSLRQQFPDGRAVIVEGHALRDDYKIKLDMRQPKWGYTKMGFEQYRKYYDDIGGFYSGFTPPMGRSDRDLHLDIGRAWAEVGLILPHWPRIVLGYEHQYKEGAKSVTTWGPVAASSGNFLDTRSFYPSVKEIDERAHVLRLDISHTMGGFEIEDHLRGEFHTSDTRRMDALNVPAGALTPNLVTGVRERFQYDQAANTVQIQKAVTDWWLTGAGYRYSWLNGDSSFGLTPQDGSGQPAAGSAWLAEKILLNEAWQVANVNSQFQLHPQLTATISGQAEWKRQETFGDANMDEVVDPSDPTSGLFRFPVTERSVLSQRGAEENIFIRHTGIPFTSLFGEVKLKQDDYERNALQDGGPHAVQLASDAAARWQDYRIGFNSSPWQRISFGGHYRHRDRETDYGYPFAQHDGAYPGFILNRNISVDDIEARLVLRPANWLKSTLIYQWSDSDFHTTTGETTSDLAGPDATPGGRVLAGLYKAHTFSANTTLTPFRPVCFSGTISYQTSETTTADNGSGAVAPYKGDQWSILTSVTYHVNVKTDLFSSYVYSQSRYGQHNASDGLPLGIDYDRHGSQVGLLRHFNKSVTGRLQYGYFAYHESSAGYLPDYTAHQVMGVVTMKW